MTDIAEIIRRHGAEYLARYAHAMPPSHRRALADLGDCRTPALGGQLFVCDRCGHFHYVYHSCRNRACPACHTQDTHAWLDARRRDLLPVPYFHLTFTVPAHLRHRFRSHQKALYPVLIRTAAETLIRLAHDPRYVGATPAVLAVLHTWSRTLVYHPHVHLLVSGGGLDADGRWTSARPRFLVPVRALSKLFRGMLLDRIAKALPDLPLPPPPRRQNWVVHCKPAVHGSHRVLRYLARYIHRVALTNARILSLHNGQVTFRYTSVAEARAKTMTLPALEFLRRFLQHVLPTGFHKVRYYGLWAASNHQRLLALQLLLPSDNPPLAQPPVDPPTPRTFRLHQSPPGPRGAPGQACPVCRLGRLLFLRRLGRHERAPPHDPIGSLPA